MNKTEKLSYIKNGFYLYKGFFNSKEVERIKKEAQSIFINQFIGKGIATSKKISEGEFESAIVRLFEEHFDHYTNCGKQAQHLISLHRLSLDERIVNKLKEFGLDFPVISTRPVMYFNKFNLAKTEEFYKVPPHQDWRSMQGSLNSMVVWVPLADVSEDLGALKIVPGSHLHGLIESKENAWFRQIDQVEQADFISVEVEAGDALFFSSFLIHSSGNNIKDKIRWSCHFRYNDLNEETFIQRGYPHPYIYKPIQELITSDFPSPDQIKKIFS
ncbi:MAG TPA: phytanoyl-CoA dioxygenase family protein [Puia sp.]|nr:phytanoyl-CoA dioxygenase family protein [Puia sp.]